MGNYWDSRHKFRENIEEEEKSKWVSMNLEFLAWTGPLESIDRNGGILSSNPSTRGSWSWSPSPLPSCLTTCCTWSLFPSFQTTFVLLGHGIPMKLIGPQ